MILLVVFVAAWYAQAANTIDAEFCRRGSQLYECADVSREQGPRW